MPLFSFPTPHGRNLKRTRTDDAGSGEALEGIELEHSPLVRVDTTSRDIFARAVFGLEANEIAHLPGFQTYLDHLEYRFSVIGCDWIRPSDTTPTFADGINIISNICTIITQKPPSSESWSIDQIAAAWLERYPGDHHSSSPPSSRSAGSALAARRRAVFCVLAWVTLVVDIPRCPANDQFHVVFPDGDRDDPRNMQRIDSNAKRPIHALLRGFCHSRLLPALATATPADNGNHSFQASGGGDQEHDLLHVSCLNFAILAEFSKITIEWTSVISCHLTFVSSTRTLYLFRLPTVCALGCTNADDETHPGYVFDRIMQNYFESSPQTTKVWLRFRQEILLSYRILFGQTKASRNYYQKTIRPQLQTKPTVLFDPLLDTLCSKTTSSTEIQSLPSTLWPRPCRNMGLEGPLRKQDEYSISTDLPLLGPRLLILQEFNLRQRPRSFWGLWRDTRDKPKWYTFWVVLIVGGFTVLLTIVQLGISIAQLAVSVQSGGG